MVGSFSRRLLAILQLTRCALVFTAISNAWAALLLRARAEAGPGGDYLHAFDMRSAVWMTCVSVGLYGFGMSLNDVIDRRRDATIASDRPIPSGRLPVAAGKVICLLLLALAMTGGILLAHRQADPRLGQISMLLTLGVGVLILCYDVAGKYLLSLGLLSLGLIRFFHATIADPTLSMPWHPLLLLDHVTILSTVAYAWEQKRPVLTRRHITLVLGGLVLINGLVIGLLMEHRAVRAGGLLDDLAVGPHLWWPAAAVAVFVGVAYVVRLRQPDSRGAGKMLMLVGLLWLIVYDATFVAAHVSYGPAIIILALMPVAWLSVKVMRIWSTLVALSEKPKYLRAD